MGGCFWIFRTEQIAFYNLFIGYCIKRIKLSEAICGNRKEIAKKVIVWTVLFVLRHCHFSVTFIDFSMTELGQSL